MAVADSQPPQATLTITKQLEAMVLVEMLELGVKEAAHVHEETLLNIMEAMEAVLSLVKVVVVMLELIVLEAMELIMVKVEEEAA
jgi:hypothetical protein